LDLLAKQADDQQVVPAQVEHLLLDHFPPRILESHDDVEHESAIHYSHGTCFCQPANHSQ
jgi:hypothetical protein